MPFVAEIGCRLVYVTSELEQEVRMQHDSDLQIQHYGQLLSVQSAL